MKNAISKWSAEGKDAKVEFGKVLDEIANCPDIASATTKAIEVFGKKAGPDLADAIQGGRFEYSDFLNLLENSNGTVETTYNNITDANDDAKIAMNNVYKKLKEANMDAKIVLQVHDELIVEAKIEDKEEAKNILKECMENAYTLNIPLKVDMEEANSWYEAK